MKTLLLTILVYDPNRWNWQDTVVAIICWSLPFFCIGMKLYLDRKWERDFHERKPRVPESPKCRGNDPFCPCQDGDLCHYEGENPMAVPESQDDIVHLGSLNNEEFRPKAIELLIAARAELRDLKLAASLACELHGCASAGCTMAQYHQDVQKFFADLAAAQAQIANLTKEANKEETRCK